MNRITESRSCPKHGLQIFIKYGPYTRKRDGVLYERWVCISCQVQSRAKQYAKNPKVSHDSAKQWMGLNPERAREIRRTTYENWRQKIWDSVFHYYSPSGPECACCKESHYEFLCIDHINGGGNKQRKKLKISSARFWLWLIREKFPSGYRVLCHNCNFAYWVRGKCPHQIT